MEIYFDRKTRKVLRYIKRYKDVTLGELEKAFGEDCDSMLVTNMCIADYLVCKHPDGTLTMFKEKHEWNIYDEDIFQITAKGNKLLEDRFDRLWQWCIPVLISVAALIISFFALRGGIIDVRIIS